MIKDQIIGIWKLVSAEFRSSDGEVSYPLGRDAVGMLMYDTNGNMSAQLTNPNIPTFVSNNQLKGSPSEIKAAYEGCVSYFGTYEINEDEGFIVHHVEGSLFPNWVGTDQKRFYEFIKDKLILRTQPTKDKELTGFLTWKRRDIK